MTAKLTQCPVCGTTAAIIEMTNRLGCPECYRLFKNEILLQLNHPSFPQNGCGFHAPVPQDNYMDLIIQLQRAVDDENYEEAAHLRDRILELKGQR